ncbi:MAG: hypothetical protein EOO02_04330 [Chitinophagaceae bacterium]|nr:MAG: hypothetical protein EOO02_04330 [Chitinophagaceae bacterium]
MQTVIFHVDCLYAQPLQQQIWSDYVLEDKRARLDKDIRENTVAKNFRLTIDGDNEHKFEDACLAISQFLFTGPQIVNGFNKMFAAYSWAEYDTRRALLEAVYAVYPNEYADSVALKIQTEIDPDLFALSAVYLLRHDPTVNNQNNLKIAMVEKFPGYDSIAVLVQLENYINNNDGSKHNRLPDLKSLFKHQRSTGRKVIYSFQRWNRDYPGLAIVQHANGEFARDKDGRLLVFQQLARSGSDLPYFLRNGSTPQGVYSLFGSAVSKTKWIGPTPNLQMGLPFEHPWHRYFHQPLAPRQDSLQLYKQLWPATWQKYDPIMEAWNAGKIGRSAIIAHGTTIDPAYFEGRPFYPLTPTMGCLCAREEWDVKTGRLQLSEQYALVNAYLSSPGKDGYLYVINLDNEQSPVSRAEIERLIK